MTDFLPKDTTFRARILSYGYSSELFFDFEAEIQEGDIKQRPFRDRSFWEMTGALRIHSNELLESLSALRGDQHRDKAIIWIGHGLGGFIIAKALIEASAKVGKYRNLKAIQLSTCGLLYFNPSDSDSPINDWDDIQTTLKSIGMKITQKRCLTNSNKDLEHFYLQMQRYNSIKGHFQHYSIHGSRSEVVDNRIPPVSHIFY